MVENRLLRENARKQLDGNIFKTKWLMMLAVCAIPALLSSASGSIYIFGAVIAIVIAGPLSYGVARTTVECVEGEKWDVSHTFKGFSENFGHSAILGFLSGLLTLLWSLLFIVPGIVKSYAYAMAFYIQQERGNKGKEPIDCITESRKMMDGHKWQLFCLDLSFLGWYIVGALCLGIGVFFVMPYHEMARANFYEALKAEMQTVVAQPVAEPAELPEPTEEKKDD